MNHRQNHFDTLKVASNAPPEVIRAAYKALSQRYHPDRNTEAEAAGIMCSLNLAYSILGDPRTRQEYEDELTLTSRSVRAEAVFHRRHLSGTDYRPRGASRTRQRQMAVTRFSLLVCLVITSALAAFIVKSEHAYAAGVGAHAQSRGSDAMRAVSDRSRLRRALR